MVKKTSLFLGADVVGIAPYDQRWVWEKRFNLYDGTHEENTFPFEPKSVIVFGFEMDYAAYQTTPSAIGDAAAGTCYSRMAVTSHSVAEFIRNWDMTRSPAAMIPQAVFRLRFRPD